MFRNDISYLYSDEYFTSLVSNEKELSNVFESEPLPIDICRKTTSMNRRSKHKFVCNDDILKRDRRRDQKRMTIRRLTEKRPSFSKNLQRKIQELENEQSHLQIQLAQLQLYKKDMNIERHRSLSMRSSIQDVSLMDENQVSFVVDQYVDDLGFSTMSITSNARCLDPLEPRLKI